MIYTVIQMKYQKYSSTTILKHDNILAKVNKLPHGRLHHMTPHDVYSITIHVHTMTIAEISKKGSKILLANEHIIKAKNAITQLCQNLFV